MEEQYTVYGSVILHTSAFLSVKTFTLTAVYRPNAGEMYNI